MSHIIPFLSKIFQLDEDKCLLCSKMHPCVIKIAEPSLWYLELSWKMGMVHGPE
jgi:hypothetical protein